MYISHSTVFIYRASWLYLFKFYQNLIENIDINYIIAIHENETYLIYIYPRISLQIDRIFFLEKAFLFRGKNIR